MRKNLPITNKNFDYPKSTRIVSTTTAKGVITYVNEDFVQTSGFSEEELIGQAHNLVRHPEMPQAAFAQLWAAMDKSEPWMGLVKNRCKNGDHYWVDAFVMNSSDKTDGKADLQSVRFKPEPEQIKRAERCYKNINQEQAPFQRLHPTHWPILAKLLALGGAMLVPFLFLMLAFSDSISTSAVIMCVLAAAAIGTTGAFVIAKPIQLSAAKAKATYSNPLAQVIYTGRGDELGAIELANQFYLNKLETALWRVVDTAKNVETSAGRSSSMAQQTELETQDQRAQLEQLATAINEMASSISEVSANTQNVSELMNNVEQRVNDGSSQVAQTNNFVSGLVSNLNLTAEKVEAISTRSHSISELVMNIHGIAEQTNLLALNAAIEAARAGEQGRGFAVVADEVRNLANGTAETTEQIQGAIKEILDGVQEAVTLVKSTLSSSNETAEQARLAHESLSDITKITQDTLAAMIQTASATEEQSAVCEEINRNVHNIQEAATKTCDNARASQTEQETLFVQVQKLTKTASDFARS